MYNACLNINECLKPGICPTNARCIDADGSYSCVCKDGYIRKERSTGFICVDKKDCDYNPCGSSMDCKELPGGYTCGCMKGYTNVGSENEPVCIDVNECSSLTQSQPCGPNSNCWNTPGSYRCLCKTGYRLVGNSCQDIDECQTYTNDCNENAECINSEGNFNCRCRDGFETRFKGRGTNGCIFIDDWGTQGGLECR